MLSWRGMAGFTLIEVLVAITIAAILMMLGAPAMSTYLQRAKVGAVTQSLQASLQTARTEAIRRNQRVEFITTHLPVAPAAVVPALPPAAATGQNWQVLAPNPDPAAIGTFNLLESRSAAEGNAGAPSIQVQASGPYAGTVVFDGFGRTVDPAGFHFNVVHVLSGCPSTEAVTCQAVRVSPGGKITTCDPTVGIADSRSCGSP